MKDSIDLVDGPALALSLFSKDDMCDRGGLTIVFATVIIAIFFGTSYWLAAPANTGKSRRRNHQNCLFRPDSKSSRFQRLLARLETIFVAPFVPRFIDQFVMWIFLAWFLITVPMFATRHYEKKWAHDTMTLQGPLNAIARLFNCGGIPIEAIPYSERVESTPSLLSLPPPVEDKWERMDWYFLYHLSLGLLWLFLGFVQIYKMKPGGWSQDAAKNKKAHRIFGRIVLFFLACHIISVTSLVSENPVNQHWIIRLAYCVRIVDTISSTWQGIRHAQKSRQDIPLEQKKEHVLKHKMYMFISYVRSTMGSGSIRVTSWALWLVGKFFTPEARMRFDRGECQTYAKQGIGDATDCWKPVFINLLLTDLLVDWLELLFLTSEVRRLREAALARPTLSSDTSEATLASLSSSSDTTTVNIICGAPQLNQDAFLKIERKNKKSQIEREAIVFLPSLLFVMMDHIWDETSGITAFLLAPLAEFASFYWFIFVRLSFSSSTRAWTVEMIATVLAFILLVARTDDVFLRVVEEVLLFPIKLFSYGGQCLCTDGTSTSWSCGVWCT